MTDSLKTKDFQDFLDGLQKCQRNLQSSSTQAFINGFSISDKNKIKQCETNLGNYIKQLKNQRLTIILGNLKKEEDIKAIKQGINELQHQIDKLNDTISFLNAATRLINTLTKVFGVFKL
jgi:predicted  nucleic acid-binding Zn-ribbon protein